MSDEASRKMALRLARRIGCSGAHQNAKGEWLPCGTEEELTKISMEAESAPAGKKNDEPPCIGCKGGTDRRRQGAGHKKRWERFRERGIAGIDTLADGSLVSAPAAKELRQGVERQRFSLRNTTDTPKHN